MKNIVFILSMLFMSGICNAQTITSFGHRNGLEPVLDFKVQDLEPIVQQSFAQFKDVHVASMELSDDPSKPDYMPSLIITIGFKETDNAVDEIFASFQFALKYDPVNNQYGDADLDPIANGGKYCARQNCVGCHPVKNDKGKIEDCSDCLPLPNGNGPNEQPYFCELRRVEGGNGIGILTAIASVLTALGGLF
jgi:hypothetical protein